MADYFENGVFGGNIPAWHGLGTVVEEDVLTSEQVIEYVPELGYEVVKSPLYVMANGENIRVPNRYATVREDGAILAAGLSDRYEVIQNREAFSFVDEMVGSGDAKYHTAGTLKDGRVAWLLAKAADITVGGIESEKIEKFLLCSNSFDGSQSLVAKWVRMRVVCANTLDVALGEGGREFRIRHTSGLDGRIEEARRILEIGFEQDDAFLTVANELVGEKMTPIQFGAFLKRLVPIPKDADLDKDRAARNKQEAREAISAIYLNAENLANVRGTKWAAYNAVAEYFDHHSRFRSSNGEDEDSKLENRFLRITSDWKLKDQALALLTK